ncbi:hypothetical protein M569_10275, partial [Genlisea aurea]
EEVRREAAEQLRQANLERAHARRLRELSRMEMELAQSELARARCMWEMAREEVRTAEKIK